jgi:hypothetical protein
MPATAYSNISLEPAVFTPGPPTSRPAEVARSFNNFRRAIGHHGLGRASSTWNEPHAARQPAHYDHLLLRLTSGPSLPLPWSPSAPTDTPFSLSLLERIISTLPSSTKSPGEDDISYCMIKHGGPALVYLLHHFLSRLWKLHAPPTHSNLLAHHPTHRSHILLSPIYKSGKIPALDPLHPKNYRGICLIITLAMIFQKRLLNSLSSFTADHRLLTPSQGACLAGLQPFDTVYALRNLIEHRHTHLRLPTLPTFSLGTSPWPSPVFFVNSSCFGCTITASPSMCGSTSVRALHHTIKLRVLHGHNAPDSYVNILKGLTEGGRLCPLLWGFYVADLVHTLQRSSRPLRPPPPHAAFFIGILLFVDDFVLLASCALELLALMRRMQIWCEDNKLELSFDKSKVMVFFEPSTRRRQRAPFPLGPGSLPRPLPSLALYRRRTRPHSPRDTSLPFPPLPTPNCPQPVPVLSLLPSSLSCVSPEPRFWLSASRTTMSLGFRPPPLPSPPFAP